MYFNYFMMKKSGSCLCGFHNLEEKKLSKNNPEGSESESGLKIRIKIRLKVRIRNIVTH